MIIPFFHWALQLTSSASRWIKGALSLMLFKALCTVHVIKSQNITGLSKSHTRYYSPTLGSILNLYSPKNKSVAVFLELKRLSSCFWSALNTYAEMIASSISSWHVGKKRLIVALFPGRSQAVPASSFWSLASDQKLEAGTAWERPGNKATISLFLPTCQLEIEEAIISA